MAGFEYPPVFQGGGSAYLYGAPNTAIIPMSYQDLFFTGAAPGPGGAPAGWIRPGSGQHNRSRVLGLGSMACTVPGVTAPGPFGVAG